MIKLTTMLTIALMAPTTGNAYIMPGSPEWAQLEADGKFEELADSLSQASARKKIAALLQER